MWLTALIIVVVGLLALACWLGHAVALPAYVEDAIATEAPLVRVAAKDEWLSEWAKAEWPELEVTQVTRERIEWARGDLLGVYGKGLYGGRVLALVLDADVGTCQPWRDAAQATIRTLVSRMRRLATV